MNRRESDHTGDELERRRAERRLFTERAAFAPAPPPFGAVLAAARRDRVERARAARWSRWAPWVGLGLTAAVSGVCLVPRALVADAPAPAVAAESLPSLACYDDPGALVAEGAAYAIDRASASVEEHSAACLEAMPGPSRTASYQGGGACEVAVESEVTCVAGRPLDDEVFEERTRGGSLQ